MCDEREKVLGASVSLGGVFILYFIIGVCKKWRSFVRLQKLISVCRIVLFYFRLHLCFSGFIYN